MGRHSPQRRVQRQTVRVCRVGQNTGLAGARKCFGGPDVPAKDVAR